MQKSQIMSSATTLMVSVVFCSCALFNTVLDEDKSRMEAHRRLGLSSLQSGQLPAALSEFQQAQKLNPSDPRIYNDIAVVYHARREFQKAEGALLKALDLNPQFTDARSNLAKLLLERHRPEEALKHLILAEKDLVYPAPEQIAYFKGLAFLALNKDENALKAFERAEFFKSNYCESRLERAKIYFQKELFEKANELLESVQMTCEEKERQSAAYFSAMSLFRLGEKDRPQSILEDLLKKDLSKDLRARVLKAIAIIR